MICLTRSLVKPEALAISSSDFFSAYIAFTTSMRQYGFFFTWTL